MWVCVEAGAKFCCVPVSLCVREIMKADSQVQHSSLCPAGSDEPQEHMEGLLEKHLSVLFWFSLVEQLGRVA